jgi:Leucine-rich repeat (LRR) protein
MKTILLGLLLFTGIVKAQIVNIPDANFKAKLLAANINNPIAYDFNNNPMKIDVNNNNEIEVSEALLVKILNVESSNIGNLIGLTSFLNLNVFTCSNNLITNLDVAGLNNLTTLYCDGNQLITLNVFNLLNLLDLRCNGNQITSLSINNLNNLSYLDCSANQITSLDVNGLASLSTLICSYNPNLTSLNLSNLSNLSMVWCNNSNINSLNLSGLTSLTSLNCGWNYIQNLPLTGLTNLQFLDFAKNQITTINLSGLTNLKKLNCSLNQIQSLDVNTLLALEELVCFNNQISTLEVNNLINLTRLSCEANFLTQLEISNLVNLQYLFFSNNQLSSINLNGLINLDTLTCSFNQLTSIDLSGLINLKNFQCRNNGISTLDLSDCNLTTLDCRECNINFLDTNNLSEIVSLYIGGNYLPNIDFSTLTNLFVLDCSYTGRTSIDVSNLTNLGFLYCAGNFFTTLDISNLSQLNILECSNNFSLLSLFGKNGINETINLFNCYSIQYVCADESQLVSIQNQLNDLGFLNAVTSSYCTFVPGGTYNTITGKSRFDITNNGCDANDPNAINLRIKINDGSNNESSLVNLTGDYIFYTGAGNFTIIPELEIPSYFTVSPVNANVNFPTVTNVTQIQDFCLTSNGVHPDLEIVILPITSARPGFDAEYKVVFKNKGNQMLSGAVTLQFDDARTDFVSALPAVNSQILNSLIWNYSNLKPFESRSILLTLNINSPVEIPAVNNGDILNFTATINPTVGDDLPPDNIFNYNQTVLGSYDPNDITCLEGDTVSPSEIGNYLHYVINFENLGTFYAENVVVKTEIDPTKYDIATLQLLNTSHLSYTRITGNTVEFIFEDINLAAAAGNPPVGGHGDVLFKIKTKDNLVTNDTVLQRAGIYFDYNFPVITNDAETTFAALNNPNFELDNSVKVYPNPSKGNVNINCNFNIKSIELYDVQGRILETNLVNDVSKTIDISTKQNGIYFIKITTEKGIKVEKIIKE